MELLPEFFDNKELIEEKMPGRTWKIDFINHRLCGMIDEEEALKQSIYLRLLTVREAHLIYSQQYGSQVTDIIGKDLNTKQLEEMVTDSLLEDDRITGVTDFDLVSQDDRAYITFTTESDIGEIETEVVI